MLLFLRFAHQVGYIGIPLAVISVVYLVTFGYWILPDTGAGMLGQVDHNSFVPSPINLINSTSSIHFLSGAI